MIVPLAVETKSIRRFAFLASIGLVIAGLLVLEVGVIAHAGSAQRASNPFIPYTDMMPGQPGAALQEAGFRCTSIPYYTDCVQRPTSGSFTRINAVVNGNAIETVRFAVKENALTVGDLMLLWGRPDFVQYGSNPTILYWEQVPASATILSQMTRPLAYFQALDFVSFGVEFEAAVSPLFVDHITLR